MGLPRICRGASQFPRYQGWLSTISEEERQHFFQPPDDEPVIRCSTTHNSDHSLLMMSYDLVCSTRQTDSFELELSFSWFSRLTRIITTLHRTSDGNSQS